MKVLFILLTVGLALVLATALTAQDPQPSAKKKAAEPTDVVARVAKDMQSAEDRLKKTDPGDVTRKIQRDIIDGLDELIKQNTKSQSGGGGGGKSSKTQTGGQPKNAGGQLWRFRPSLEFREKVAVIGRRNVAHRLIRSQENGVQRLGNLFRIGIERHFDANLDLAPLESLFDFFLLFVRVNWNQRQRIHKLILLGVIDPADAPRFDRPRSCTDCKQKVRLLE